MYDIRSAFFAAAFVACGLPDLAAYASAPAASARIDAAELEDFFTTELTVRMREAGVPGAVAAVVRDGRIVFEGGYGLAQKSPVVRMSPATTLVRVGSLSKLFTWTAAIQLAAQGKLDLDAPVARYGFELKGPYSASVTLRALMTHSAGFDQSGRNLFVERPADRVPLDDYLREEMPALVRIPGGVASYSNYGAALGGRLVEIAGGAPYAEVVERSIFGLLGMTSTTFRQPPNAGRGVVADGFGPDGRRGAFETVGPEPAGAASSTAHDMALFMIAHLDGETLAPAAAMRLMHETARTERRGFNGMTLGFFVEDRNGLHIIGHAGDTPNFHSALHLFPEERLGLFIAVNGAGKHREASKALREVFRAFVDRFYPSPALAPPPTPSAFASAAMLLAGPYLPSIAPRRGVLAIGRLFGQYQIEPNGVGAVRLKPLLGSGDGRRWIATDPLTFREQYGRSRIGFLAKPGGGIAGFVTDDFEQATVFERVAPTSDARLLLALLGLGILSALALAVLAAAQTIRTWMARREFVIDGRGALLSILTLIAATGWAASFVVASSAVTLGGSAAAPLAFSYVATAALSGLWLISAIDLIARLRDGVRVPVTRYVAVASTACILVALVQTGALDWSLKF